MKLAERYRFCEEEKSGCGSKCLESHSFFFWVIWIDDGDEQQQSGVSVMEIGLSVCASYSTSASCANPASQYLRVLVPLDLLGRYFLRSD
jgi:hypothetical protein